MVKLATNSPSLGEEKTNTVNEVYHVLTEIISPELLLVSTGLILEI